MGMDIGPKTIEDFTGAIAGAGTVIWNGPMGVFEFPAFANGTNAVAKAMADQKDAVTIVSSGGRVNIRVGNGTKYTRITAAKPGKTYPWVATAENGWHAIEIAGKVGWVSGEFSRKN